VETSGFGLCTTEKNHPNTRSGYQAVQLGFEKSLWDLSQKRYRLRQSAIFSCILPSAYYGSIVILPFKEKW
jgi:hypothetical protein